jgi:HEAT repeat protein
MGVFLLLVAIAQDPGALIERLRSDQVDVREEAAQSLQDLGRPALPGLEKASRDPDPEVAARARLLVRKIRGTADFSPALLAAFPGIEDRLGKGTDHDWTLAFLLALRGQSILSRDDLAPLVLRAVRGASTNEEKANCCLAICDLRLRASWKVLVELMKEGDDQVCRAATQALRIIGSTEEAAPAIIELLRHPNAHARMHAADLLPDLGAREAIPQITRLLADPQGGVRGIAAGALARLEGARALPKLLLVLKLDPAPWVRLETAKAIHLLRPKDSYGPLLPLLRDPDGTVRMGVLMLLDAHLSPPHGRAVAPLLGDPDPEIRIFALRILQRLECRETGEAMLPLLEDPIPEIRAAAADALGDLRVTSAGPKLVPLLEDPDTDARRAAADALGWLDFRESARGLLRALDDPRAVVRRSSARALSRLDIREAAPAIARRIEVEKDRAVVTALYESLGDLGGVEASPTLLLHAAAWSPEAIVALGRVGARKAIPILLPMTREGPIEARSASIRALAMLSAKEAVPNLLEALNHPLEGPCLCGEACRALASIDLAEYRSRFPPLLRIGDSHHREMIARTLGWLTIRESIPDLVDPRNLVDPAASAWALGKLGAVESARGLVLECTPEGSRWQTAAWALARMEAIDQVPPLIKRLSVLTGERRVPVAATLCQLGSWAGVPVLVEEGDSLWAVNALRESARWKDLRKTRISPLHRRPTLLALLGRLEAHGWTIECVDSPSVRLALDFRPFEPGWEPAQVEPLDLLEYLAPQRIEWILEKDRIRIVPQSEAAAFWHAWWGEEKEKR